MSSNKHDPDGFHFQVVPNAQRGNSGRAYEADWLRIRTTTMTPDVGRTIMPEAEHCNLGYICHGISGLRRNSCGIKVIEMQTVLSYALRVLLFVKADLYRLE